MLSPRGHIKVYLLMVMSVMASLLTILTTPAAHAATVGAPGQDVTYTDAYGGQITWHIVRNYTGTGHGTQGQCFLNSTETPGFPNPDDSPGDDNVCTHDLVGYTVYINFKAGTRDMPFNAGFQSGATNSAGAYINYNIQRGNGSSSFDTVKIPAGVGSGTMENGTIKAGQTLAGSYTVGIQLPFADQIGKHNGYVLASDPLKVTYNNVVTGVADKGFNATLMPRWDMITSPYLEGGQVTNIGGKLYLKETPSYEFYTAQQTATTNNDKGHVYIGTLDKSASGYTFTIFNNNNLQGYSGILYSINGGPTQPLPANGKVHANKLSDVFEFYYPAGSTTEKVYYRADPDPMKSTNGLTNMDAPVVDMTLAPDGAEYGSLAPCNADWKPYTAVGIRTSAYMDTVNTGNNNCGRADVILPTGNEIHKLNTGETLYDSTGKPYVPSTEVGVRNDKSWRTDIGVVTKIEDTQSPMTVCDVWDKRYENIRYNASNPGDTIWYRLGEQGHFYNGSMVSDIPGAQIFYSTTAQYSDQGSVTNPQCSGGSGWVQAGANGTLPSGMTAADISGVKVIIPVGSINLGRSGISIAKTSAEDTSVYTANFNGPYYDTATTVWGSQTMNSTAFEFIVNHVMHPSVLPNSTIGGGVGYSFIPDLSNLFDYQNQGGKLQVHIDKCVENLKFKDQADWTFVQVPEDPAVKCGPSNSYYEVTLVPGANLRDFYLPNGTSMRGGNNAVITGDVRGDVPTGTTLTSSETLIPNTPTGWMITPGWKGTSSTSLVTGQASLIGSQKTVVTPLQPVNTDITYRVLWFNYTNTSTGRTQFIDVFPYNGDGRNTSFSGTSRLKSIVYDGFVAQRSTMEYTTAAPNTISNDPAASSNAPGGSTIWSSTPPADMGTVTAIRFTDPNLSENSSQAYSLTFAENGNRDADVYWNSIGTGPAADLQLPIPAPPAVKAEVYDPNAEKALLKIDKEPGVYDAATGTITYKVTAKNAGPDTAVNVRVDDVGGTGLDPSTIAYSAMTKGTASGKTWSLGDMVAGETQTATVTVKTATGANPNIGFTNTVKIYDNWFTIPTGTVQVNADVDSDTDRQDSVFFKENSILKIDKTVASNSNPAPGEKVIYNITVKNAGTDPAPNVVVNDIPGANLTSAVFAIPPVGTVSGSTWTIPVLNPGQSVTTQVSVTAASTFTGTSLVNDVTVSNALHPVPSTPLVPNPNVDADTDQQDRETITPDNVLKIDKTAVNPNSLVPGQNTTYTITVKNAGSLLARNVVVHDVPGANLDASTVAFSGMSRGTFANGVWNVGDLPAGSTATATVTVRVSSTIDPAQPVVNGANVSNPWHPVPTTPVVPNPNVDADTDQQDVVSIIPDNVLKIDKTLVNGSNLYPGGRLYYRVTVKNAGTSNAPLVQVKDIPGVNLNAASASFYNPSAGTVSGASWNVGTLAPGASATAMINVDIASTVDITKPVVNDAVVSNPWNPTPTTPVVENPDVDSDTDQQDRVTVTDNSVLKIDKTANPGQTIVPGGDYTYTVTVKNSGNGPATQVSVHDIPGADFTDVTLSNPSAGTIAGDTWTIDTLDAGQTATVTVTAKIATTLSGNPMDNTATVSNPWHTTPTTPVVPNPDVDTDTDQQDKVTVTPNSVLKIDKTVNPGQHALPGKDLTYTLTAKNAGPDAAGGVKVTEIPGVNIDPASVRLSNPSVGTVNGSNWIIGTMKAGDTATVTVTVKVSDTVDLASGVINGASIENPSHPTPTTPVVPNPDVDTDTDQQDMVTVTEKSILKVDKTPVPGQHLIAGGQYDYILTVKNAGTEDAADVTVNDLTGDNLTNAVISDVTAGTATGSSWNIPVLAAGQTATAKVTAKVVTDLTGTGAVNSATISNPWHPTPTTPVVPNDDVDGDDDQQDVVVTPPVSTLKVDKAITGDVTYAPGSTVTYTVTAKNVGPDAAGAVTVNDYPVSNIDPATVVLSDPSMGSISGTQWNVGTMNPGDTATVKVTAKVTDTPDVSQGVTNRVTITNPSNPVPNADPVPNDDVDADTDQQDIVTVTERSILKIDKVMDSGQGIVPGKPITYTVTVKNAGTTGAPNVSVTDVPGHGLVSDSISLSDPSQGTANGATWSVGDLAPGATATVKVTGTVDPDIDTMNLSNTATVSNPWHPTPTTPAVPNDDVDGDDDQQDVVSTDGVATLKVHKEITSKSIVPGKSVTYKVTAKNAGPDAALGVKVTDIPGDNLDATSMVLSDPSAGTIDQGVWTLGTMTPGQTETITVTVNVDKDVKSLDKIVNDTTIEGLGNPLGDDSAVPNGDVDSDTDQKDVVDTLVNAHLKVDKTITGKPVMTPGGTLTYTITAKNVGPDAADKVVVTDIPSANIDPTSIVLSDPSVGKISGTKWDLGTMNPGDTATVKVTAKIATKLDSSQGVSNMVTIANPQNPVPVNPPIPNDDVDSDGDQQDIVTLKLPTVLQVAKKITSTVVRPGGEVTYRVTAHNAGLGDARNVVVDDMGGSNLISAVFSAPSKGRVSDSKWVIPVLKAGETVTATVTAKVKENASGNSVNAVSIYSADHPQIDGSQTNNDDVTTDTDQWDQVTTPITPEPVTPPTPKTPSVPKTTPPAPSRSMTPPPASHTPSTSTPAPTGTGGAPDTKKQTKTGPAVDTGGQVETSLWDRIAALFT